MSDLFWKFTTIKEWKPDLLSEEDNPDNPLCLLLNESKEAIAMLAPHVDKNCNVSYVFSQPKETKTFNTLEEAANYIGLDEDNVYAYRFLNKVRKFVLSEQARFERESIYYDGIHTPYNNALHNEKLIEKIDESYASSNSSYYSELLTEEATTYPGDEQSILRAIHVFTKDRLDKKYSFVSFNNWVVKNTMSREMIEFCTRNSQINYHLSQFAAEMLDSSDNVVDVIKNTDFESKYIDYIKNNINDIELESDINRIRLNINQFDGHKDFVIRFFVKRLKEENTVLPDDINMNNLYFGIKVEDKNKNTVDLLFEGSKTEHLLDSIVLNSLNNFTTTIFDTAEHVETKDGGNYFKLKFKNGITTLITLSGHNSYSMRVFNGDKWLNSGEINNSQYKENLSMDIPPLWMNLNLHSLENILSHLSKRVFAHYTNRNTFYDQNNIEDLTFDKNGIAFLSFNNGYGVRIKKEDNGLYDAARFNKGDKDMVFDEKDDIEANELKSYINSTVGMSERTQASIERSVYESDLTLDDLDVLKNPSTNAVRISFTNKEPHNLDVIIKNIPGNEDGNYPSFDLKISEIGGTSENKDNFNYDISAVQLEDSNYYPVLQEFLKENNITFPLSKVKNETHAVKVSKNGSGETNETFNRIVPDKENYNKLLKCINFIKNNNIGSSDESINNLIEHNKDKIIKFYYPNDKEITATDLHNDFDGLNENDPIFYCFVQADESGVIHAFPRYVSVIYTKRISGNDKTGYTYRTQYMQYSNKENIGFPPESNKKTELSPYQFSIQTTKGSSGSVVNQPKIRDERDLLEKFAETQHKKVRKANIN